MDIELIFGVSNVLVLPFWFLMIGLPVWSTTERIIRSAWIIAPLALIYVGLLVFSMGQGGDMGQLLNPTAAGIAELLSTPEAAAVAWAHFLAFDLFMGRWIYLDSRRRRISPWVMWLPLLFTLMLGPVGYLIYMVVRMVMGPSSQRNSDDYDDTLPMVK